LDILQQNPGGISFLMNAKTKISKIVGQPMRLVSHTAISRDRLLTMLILTKEPLIKPAVKIPANSQLTITNISIVIDRSANGFY
jgi:hypothetical protein